MVNVYSELTRKLTTYEAVLGQREEAILGVTVGDDEAIILQ